MRPCLTFLARAHGRFFLGNLTVNYYRKESTGTTKVTVTDSISGTVINIGTSVDSKSAVGYQQSLKVVTPSQVRALMTDT